MHFCDDQVFLEQCRLQERKDTCAPFPADCFDLFDICKNNTKYNKS